MKSSILSPSMWRKAASWGQDYLFLQNIQLVSKRQTEALRRLLSAGGGGMFPIPLLQSNPVTHSPLFHLPQTWWRPMISPRHQATKKRGCVEQGTHGGDTPTALRRRKWAGMYVGAVVLLISIPFPSRTLCDSPLTGGFITQKLEEKKSAQMCISFKWGVTSWNFLTGL